MRETWYVLEDGTAVHPSEVATNETGKLAHNSGLVAMRDDGETPRSVGVDVDESAAHGVEKTPVVAPAAKPRDMQAERPAQGYKTRQTKTRR